nr:DNA translocase FtsK 4TM domain-containing protein [Candidatus Paceibacterota bacterium]
MARKKQKPEESYKAVVRWTVAVFLIAFGLILALGSLNMAGLIGSAAYSLAFDLLGIGALLLPIFIVGGGVSVMLKKVIVPPITLFGSLLIVSATLTFLGIITKTWGGSAGVLVGEAATEFFGMGGAIILLLALIAVGLIIATDIVALLETMRTYASKAGDAIGGVKLPTLKEKHSDEDEQEEEQTPEAKEESAPKQDREPVITMFNKNQAEAPEGAIVNFDAEYKAPPLSLLGEDKGKPGVGDIKANANIIKRTFLNFGISVEMDEVSVGPTVTRYALKPAEGVRLSKIVSLQNNLELALASHPVRIEAPIPGKSLVGIEVPNTSKAMVGLGGVMSAPEWSANPKPILSAIGRDITGTPHYVNIAKMPHGLIAGATGSGKSVAIHAVITSLLYRNG